jgi:anaerobic ribonucleoside-triphosphate reductase activating protein
MLKYTSAKITFQELPTEISLTVSISGCKHRCIGCHSPHLREDIGDDLNTRSLETMITKNKYATCVTFLGGDHSLEELSILLNFVRSSGLKTAVYSGCNYISEVSSILKYVDYLKIGGYNHELGGLDSKRTNQILYKLPELTDITHLFWGMTP